MGATCRKLLWLHGGNLQETIVTSCGQLAGNYCDFMWATCGKLMWLHVSNLRKTSVLHGGNLRETIVTSCGRPAGNYCDFMGATCRKPVWPHHWKYYLKVPFFVENKIVLFNDTAFYQVRSLLFTDNFIADFVLSGYSATCTTLQHILSRVSL